MTMPVPWSINRRFPIFCAGCISMPVQSFDHCEMLRAKAQAVGVQPVGDVVVDGCMQAVIEQQDLCYTSGRGLFFLYGPNVF